MNPLATPSGHHIAAHVDSGVSAPDTKAGLGRHPDLGHPADRPGGDCAQKDRLDARPKPPLVAVLGPTASGKSALALFLAERLNGEIINFDSVQIYRGFDIGSGKISAAERRRISHHLLGVLDPEEACTAGRFRRMAIDALAEIRQRGRLAILAGGTGLYLRTLLEGLSDGPERSDSLRARLRKLEMRRGGVFLHRLLARLDPETGARIHPNDTQKVIRAIEICVLAGEPVSALHARGKRGIADSYQVIKIGLSPARQELAARINQRVECMFASGLLDEVRLLAATCGNRLSGGAALALGYREGWRVLQGEMDQREALRATQVATRRYAKRQMTWFRREQGVKWLPGFGHDPGVQQAALSWLCDTLPFSRAWIAPTGNKRVNR